SATIGPQSDDRKLHNSIRTTPAKAQRRKESGNKKEQLPEKVVAPFLFRCLSVQSPRPRVPVFLCAFAGTYFYGFAALKLSNDTVPGLFATVRQVPPFSSKFTAPTGIA